MTSTFKEIADKLTELGAVEYQLVEKEGKVRWRDKDQIVVGYSNCKTIMSFASTNNSTRWGLMQADQALPKPEWYGIDSMKMNMTEPDARELALKAAIEAGAEYMFAGTMLTLTIYLACFDVQFGDDGEVNEMVPWHPIAGDMNQHRDFILGMIKKMGFE